MTTATGRFETSNASRYLQQLCKHFAHKVEARGHERAGTVALSSAQARFEATPSALVVALEGAGWEDLARAREVIEAHLARFVFRESFERMDWDDPLAGIEEAPLGEDAP